MDKLTDEEKAEIAEILRQLAWDKRDEAFHLPDRGEGKRLRDKWKAELEEEAAHFAGLADGLVKEVE